MNKPTYKSLLEQGKAYAVKNKARIYHPCDDTLLEELRCWQVNVAEQYSDLSFEEQKSLVGLSEIISSIFENNKAIYYAGTSRELLQKGRHLYSRENSE